MIPISAYTEPVLVPAVNDLPQPNEDIDRMSDEADESSGFAQILASLLQNTEKIQTDIPPVEISGSDINLDLSSADEIEGQEKLNLYEGSEHTEISAEDEISDNEISEEYFNALASVENLFNSVKTQTSGIEDFQHEEIGVKTAGLQEKDLSNKTGIEEELSLKDFNALSEKAVKNEEMFSEAERQRISSLMDKAAKEPALSKKENTEALSGSKITDVKKPEGEPKGKLDEMRNRRRDKVSFEVRDMRTGTEINTAKTRSFSAVEVSAKRAGTDASVREITLELRLPEGQNGSVPVQGQTIWETRSGNNGSVSTAFENLLTRELHQNFNGDIVRHASIALRDGGEGTIRIALKPESLGNVKIHLEMTENKITGHIVVESKEALNAFRKELSSLEQAFKDSGFTSADLNLSLTSEGQNNRGREEDANPFSPMMAASRYDDSSVFGDDHRALLADVLIGRTSGSINMLA